MFDITDYLFRNFEDIRPYGNPQTDWSINCIHCDDYKHHLNVSIEKEVVHCWKCGYGNSWIGFVMDYSGLKYYQAIGELYKIPRMREFDAAAEKIQAVATLHKLNEPSLPKDFQLLHKADESYAGYMHYMQNRGFDADICKHYNIGVADSVPSRIIIPIEKGYWQGRALYNWQKPKYLNPKSEARDIIFNYDALKIYTEVVVCEGAFSAMAVGFNAIALIGKEAPAEKLERLVTSQVEHFIIALEPGAWGTMSKLVNALNRNGKRVTIWQFTMGDPADKHHDFKVFEYDMKTKIRLDLQV